MTRYSKRFRLYVPHISECTLQRSIFYKIPEECNNSNEHCANCIHNKLNYDEGGFFSSFIPKTEYSPLKRK